MSDFAAAADDDSVDIHEAENDYDDWAEDEDLSLISLFCHKEFHSLKELIDHDRDTYDFDLGSVAKTFGDDEKDLIMMVNFIRHEVKNALSIDAAFITKLKISLTSKEFLNDEVYMKPVLAEDALLFTILDGLNDKDDDEDYSEFQNKDKALELQKSMPYYDDIKEAMEDR